MPLASANWKVLLPVWRGLTGAGWDSLARLADLVSCATAGTAAHSAAVTQSAGKRANLEPVKPAAALFLFGGRRLAALGDFGIGIDRPAGIGRGRGAEQAVGEIAIGILDGGALIRIQAGTNGGIAG